MNGVVAQLSITRIRGVVIPINLNLLQLNYKLMVHTNLLLKRLIIGAIATILIGRYCPLIQMVSLIGINLLGVELRSMRMTLSRI